MRLEAEYADQVFVFWLNHWLKEDIQTWLKNGQTAVCVSKHQFAFFIGMPSEETDIRQEGMCFLIHRHPGVRASIHPDVKWATLRNKRHPVGRVQTPADRGGNSCGSKGDVVKRHFPTLPPGNGLVRSVPPPLVLSSLATAFCSATFQMMSRLSAEAEANRSGLSGHQLMAVMVFLCSDMMDLSLNSLYCWSN